MQREIVEPRPLLDARGRLTCPGWARGMRYVYERRLARGPLKEWDFYQMLEDGMLLQLTIGHVSYMASFSATLLNLLTGERRVFTRMRPLPLRSLPMGENPEPAQTLAVSGRDFSMAFTHGDGVRSLRLEAAEAEIDVMFEAGADNEKMVIATPFDKPGQFYLNYKENFYTGRGRARIGDMVHTFTDAAGLLDWGRGVWPYRHEWYWGSGAAVVDGHRFGFNLGWGFGDLRHATENVFFLDGRAHKLGRLNVERGEGGDRMQPWRFADPERGFDLELRPFFDNFTETNFGLVRTRCHQLFGRFNGYATLEDGSRFPIENLAGFCEHAVNRW
ncbi:MAG: DUF2804 domain-containing protein [Clostridia bacterium]|nr:DUF2804 domain-containing protein [Clostridia bacterium]